MPPAGVLEDTASEPRSEAAQEVPPAPARTMQPPSQEPTAEGCLPETMQKSRTEAPSVEVELAPALPSKDAPQETMQESQTGAQGIEVKIDPPQETRQESQTEAPGIEASSQDTPLSTTKPPSQQQAGKLHRAQPLHSRVALPESPEKHPSESPEMPDKSDRLEESGSEDLSNELLKCKAGPIECRVRCRTLLPANLGFSI